MRKYNNVINQTIHFKASDFKIEYILKHQSRSISVSNEDMYTDHQSRYISVRSATLMSIKNFLLHTKAYLFL